MMRATGSVEPPGGKGTTIFIGPLGHSPRVSARTMAGAASSAVVPASTERRRSVRWRGLVNLVLPDSFVVLFPYTSALRMGKPDSFANRDVEEIAVRILALAARREPVAQDLRQLGAAADQLGPRGVDVLGPETYFGRPPADFRGAVVQGDDAAVGIEFLPALPVLDEVQPQHVAIERDHSWHGLGEQHDPTHRQQHPRPPSGDHPGTVRFFCQARPHRLFNRNHAIAACPPVRAVGSGGYPSAGGRPARSDAAGRRDLGVRAGMEGAEGRHRGREEHDRQRRRIRHRQARRTQRRAVPERRQHGQCRHDHPARARPLRRHRHRGERHRRRRRSFVARWRCRGGRPVGPVSRSGVRARGQRQVRAAAVHQDAVSQPRHDLPDRAWRAQRQGGPREAVLVRRRSRDDGGSRQDRRRSIEALHGRPILPARRAAPGRRRQRRLGPGVRRQRHLPAIRVRDLQGSGARHGERCRGDGRLCQRRAVHRLPQPVRPRRRQRDSQRDEGLLPTRRGQFGGRRAAIPGGVDATPLEGYLPDMSLIKGETGDWEIVLGLEVHAQVISEAKLFSGAPTAFGADPNTQVSLVDAAMPGMLPVINARCVEQAVRTGLGLNAKINLRSVFDRKNYFYADLPQGYQISQYKDPIVGEGCVEIDLEGGKSRTIGIERLHLEQDAAKSFHDQHPSQTYVDLNRSGVALMEIVSKPDMRTADEAAAYLAKLRSIVRYLGTCDGNMDEGSVRCDVNVSVRKPGGSLGTRCEIKNVNSIRFVKQAIEYEARRQIEVIEGGGKIVQETRRFDPGRGETLSMRSKEDAHDYRYFPDPDLLPLVLTQDYVDRIKADLPELPDAKKDRFVSDYRLTPYDAGVLVAEKETAEFFETVAKGRDAKEAVKLVTGDFFAMLNRRGATIADSPISAEHLGRLL